jgi:hypothetical protein
VFYPKRRLFAASLTAVNPALSDNAFTASPASPETAACSSREMTMNPRKPPPRTPPKRPRNPYWKPFAAATLLAFGLSGLAWPAEAEEPTETGSICASPGDPKGAAPDAPGQA